MRSDGNLPAEPTMASPSRRHRIAIVLTNKLNTDAVRDYEKLAREWAWRWESGRASATTLAVAGDTAAGREAQGAAGVSVAVTALTGPGETIVATFDAAVADGCDRVTLLVPTADALRTTVAWVRRVANHWRKETGSTLDIRVAVQKIHRDALWSAMDDIAADAELPHSVLPSTGSTPRLLSPAWEEVPQFRRHLLVCRGPRCSALGIDRCMQPLLEAGFTDEDVLITNAGCMYPCTLGPVAAVYPEGVWYGHLDTQAMQRIVDEHLIGGRVVAEYVIDRVLDHPRVPGTR